MAAAKTSVSLALLVSLALHRHVLSTSNETEVTVVDEAGNNFWESEAVWGECDTGERQSPIVILTDDVTEDNQLGRFSVSTDFSSPLPKAVYHRSTNTYVLQNEPGEGEGASIRVTPTVSEAAEGSPQMSFLMLALFFGSPNSDKGSQHSVDQKQYPAEVDIYFGDGPTVNTSTNFVAWCVFVQISDDIDDVESMSLMKLFQQTKSLALLGDSVEMNEQIILSELTHVGAPDEQVKMGAFFRYSGSLTTPPCEENVQWTVYEHPIYVTSATYSMLFDTDGGTRANDDILTDNFRPPKPLNGRRVTKPKSNQRDPLPPTWVLLLLTVTWLSTQVN